MSLFGGADGPDPSSSSSFRLLARPGLGGDGLLTPGSSASPSDGERAGSSFESSSSSSGASTVDGAGEEGAADDDDDDDDAARPSDSGESGRRRPSPPPLPLPTNDNDDDDAGRSLRQRRRRSPAAADQEQQQQDAAAAAAAAAEENEHQKLYGLARTDFLWSMTEEPHRSRRLAILKAHPEVRTRKAASFSRLSRRGGGVCALFLLALEQ